MAKYLAESGLFSELRLVSRDVLKESALAIKAECEAKGAKVILVSANLDDDASIDQALAGATHSFLVTNWWELFFANGAVPGAAGFVAGKKAQELEEAQGKRWVDLCKKHALEFVVYSGLCDAEKHSGGQCEHIYHFQGKAKVGRRNHYHDIWHSNITSFFTSDVLIILPVPLLTRAHTTPKTYTHH